MNKMETTYTKMPGDSGKTCLDYFGNLHPHGAYFKAPFSVCSECLCNNGMTTKCISMQCSKPTCDGYKRMPGKCCDYVCPDYQATDATTLAILITLSITLLLIIIAIVVVWRKMRRKKLFGNRLDSISTSSNQDTDTETMIERNSIPNNKRQQFNYQTPTPSTNRKLTSPENTTAASSLVVKKHFSKHFVSNNSNKLATNNVTQKQNNSNKKTIYSKVSSFETDVPSLSSASDLKVTTSSSDINSTPLLDKNNLSDTCYCSRNSSGKKRCNVCEEKTCAETSKMFADQNHDSISSV